MGARWVAILLAAALLFGCDRVINVKNLDSGAAPDEEAGVDAGGAADASGAGSGGGKAGSGGQAGAPSGGSGAGGAGGAGGATGGVGGAGGGAVPMDAGPIDCSMVGCAPPPLCSTGCTEPCGCCPCSEGETMNSYVCKGGCWAENGDGGAALVCKYNGVSYPAGASFPAGDGCNSCSCSNDGLVACTAMACVCDPASEAHRRSYIRASPKECGVIDFTCPQNTTYFSNQCGCGCEQSPSCPEWFNCMPGPGTTPCDEKALLARCPYSGIAY